jgi:hypothetical protein
MAVVPKDDALVVVDRCELPPGHCIATMSDQDARGFVDTLLTPALVDPRVYLSVSYIEEVARKLGMEYEAEGKIAGLEARVEELELELSEADKRIEAIDVMESAGFTARKRPGRKPAKPKAKA